MDNKGGKLRGGGDGGVLNWAIGIDMYTLMCIKLMTNKNLLYKKINKIKLKNLKKTSKKKDVVYIFNTHTHTHTHVHNGILLSYKKE